MSDRQRQSGAAPTLGLGLIALLHGFVALGGLIPLFYGLLGAGALGWGSDLFFLLVPALVVAVGFSTMYAFFARRRWGLCVAVLGSAWFFLCMSVPTGVWWLFLRVESVEAPLAGALYLSVMLLAPLGMIGICLSPTIRGAMNR